MAAETKPARTAFKETPADLPGRGSPHSLPATLQSLTSLCPHAYGELHFECLVKSDRHSKTLKILLTES